MDVYSADPTAPSQVGMTPTGKRIMAILYDGQVHSKELELYDCLSDELYEANTLNVHISSLRKLLRPQGLDIMCRKIEKQIFFQLVRLLASPNDGRK